MNEASHSCLLGFSSGAPSWIQSDGAASLPAGTGYEWFRERTQKDKNTPAPFFFSTLPKILAVFGVVAPLKKLLLWCCRRQRPGGKLSCSHCSLWQRATLCQGVGISQGSLIDDFGCRKVCPITLPRWHQRQALISVGEPSRLSGSFFSTVNKHLNFKEGCALGEKYQLGLCRSAFIIIRFCIGRAWLSVWSK